MVDRHRVLIVQNDPNEGPGRLPVALTEAAVEFDVRAAWRDGVPSEVSHDALVVLGGPMGVYDAGEYPFLADEMRLISTYHAAGRPVLGICLGAQLAAAALGGQVRATDRFEAGWAPIHLTPGGLADPVVAPLQAAPAVFHLHGDTFDPPPGAVRLASTEAFAEQGFRLGNTVALQFHVEVDPQTARGWLDASAATLADHELDAGSLADAPPGAATGLDRVLERVALFLDGRLPGQRPK